MPEFLAVCIRSILPWGRAASPLQTLDQLRSALSHEPAAKFARLATLLAEWEAGRFRRGDEGVFRGLLRGLSNLYSGRERLAADSFRTLALQARVTAILRGMDRRLRRSDPRSGPSAKTRQQLARDLRALRQAASSLVERLTVRQAVRITDLVYRAVEEVGREGAASPRGETVSVSPEVLGAHGTTWIARSSEASWLDVHRNFIRNAVQATEEQRARLGAGAGAALEERSTGVRRGGGTRNPQPVQVRVSALPDRPGVLVEIADEGVGMTPEEIEAMWCAGAGRHGRNRGRGLTEAKLAFLRANGAFHVRSAPGAGTTLAIEVPEREIALRRPPLWRCRPVQAAAALLIGAALVAPALRDASPARTIRDGGGGLIIGVDARGRTVWERDFDVLISPCSPYERESPEGRPRAVHRNPDGSIRDLLIATEPKNGSGEFILLDGRGEELWRRPLTWISPKSLKFDKLLSTWQVPVRWGDPPRDAYAVIVRDCNYAPCSIQVLSLEGTVLGAYFHPGHLSYHAQQDLDGDGKEELLLRGINNRGGADSSLAGDVGGTWFGCVLLLGPDDLGGQAFPYTTWEGIPPAREKAYLLIPPIRRDLHGHVGFVLVGLSESGDPPNVEAWLADGRCVSTDPLLRPLSLGIGDNTDASRIFSGRGIPETRLAYFRNGIREIIELGGGASRP